MFQLDHNDRESVKLSKLHAKLVNTKVAAQAVFYGALGMSVLILALKL